MRKAILRTDKGLAQLYKCPSCNYMIMQNDIVWEKQPADINDSGVIKCCKFCSKEDLSTTGKAGGNRNN